MARSLGSWTLVAALLVSLSGCGALLGAASGLSRPARASTLSDCTTEPCPRRADVTTVE